MDGKIREINGVKYQDNSDGSVTNLSTGEVMDCWDFIDFLWETDNFFKFVDNNRPKVKMITLNSYNDFLTAKKAGTFKDLKEGDEISMAWGPLTKCVMLELFLLFDTNGLRPYFLMANDDYLTISFEEEA